MVCPFCKANDDKVVDSRPSEAGRSVRRRRECLRCGRRFTTYERFEEAIKLSVIKKDGSRMPYDRKYMLEGIQRAAYKRKIPSERIEQIVDEVEEFLVANHEKEVSSQTIGEQISKVLRRVDRVAYVRFASVYREFKDVGDFIDEVQDVIKRSADDVPGQQSLFDEGAES